MAGLLPRLRTGAAGNWSRTQNEARSRVIVNHKVGEPSAPYGSDSIRRRIAAGYGCFVIGRSNDDPNVGTLRAAKASATSQKTAHARQTRLMLDGTTLFVAAVFALAGLVKGVIGMGLPTVSMGLLAVVMSPLEAAALLVLPSFLTNLWQMIAGP